MPPPPKLTTADTVCSNIPCRVRLMCGYNSHSTPSPVCSIIGEIQVQDRVLHELKLKVRCQPPPSEQMPAIAASVYSPESFPCTESDALGPGAVGRKLPTILLLGMAEPALLCVGRILLVSKVLTSRPKPSGNVSRYAFSGFTLEMDGRADWRLHCISLS